MKKITFLLFFLLSSNLCYAQTEKEDNLINLNQVKEKELYSLQTKGWTLLKSNEDETYLANLSNKEYILYLSLTCKDQTTKPQYLIEHNNNYGDGEWGGLDFSSSQTDDGKIVKWLIDQKEIDNPFKRNKTSDFEKFKVDLKKGKILSLKFYNEDFNPDTGKEEARLNREINFNLENSYLLDVPTDCEKEDISEVETTVVAEAAQ